MFITEELTADIYSAKEKIKSLRADDSVVFPIFTDLHANSASDPKVSTLCEVLNLICREIECDMVVDLGDNPNMLGRDEHISNSDLKVVLESTLRKIYAACGVPLVNVNGNHDAIGTDFFKPDYWNDIVKHKFGADFTVYDDIGSYFYFDCDKAKTRFIALSAPHDSDLYAENPTPIWEFGERQLDWLESTALDTEYDVIILMHVPGWARYSGDMTKMLGVWNGEKAAMSRIADLCGWINDIDRASAILKAYKGRVIASLSGHTHSDSVFAPHEEKGRKTNPFHFPQFTTAAVFKSMVVDIAVWTPSKNLLEFIRIGEGEDRE